MWEIPKLEDCAAMRELHGDAYFKLVHRSVELRLGKSQSLNEGSSNANSTGESTKADAICGTTTVQDC